MNSSKQGRLARKSLMEVERNKFSDLICEKVKQFIKEDDVVMLYNAFDGEVDVSSIKAKKIILPTIREEKIVPVEKTTKTLLGKYNINEPVGNEYLGKIDVFVVPMCAFDRKMMRSGFGKGYYDRLLADKKGLKIGVAFSCQEQEEILKKPTDVCMDIIVTEKEIFK